MSEAVIVALAIDQKDENYFAAGEESSPEVENILKCLYEEVDYEPDIYFLYEKKDGSMIVYTLPKKMVETLSQINSMIREIRNDDQIVWDLLGIDYKRLNNLKTVISLQ